jgi:hypothetical protein
LQLTVRKFFCPNPSCPRKIFAEQFPELVPSYARLTTRLRDALVALGLATCGELSSRLAPRLGMQVAPTTLLRRVRAFCWLQQEGYGSLEWMSLPGRKARPMAPSW